MRCMHRTNIYVTDEQRAALAERAAAEGISTAELVRRLIDQALFGTSEDLADDLAAIDVSFGALRDVEFEVDRADGQRGVHLDRIRQL
jgi:plasmid stability protein